MAANGSKSPTDLLVKTFEFVAGSDSFPVMRGEQIECQALIEIRFEAIYSGGIFLRTYIPLVAAPYLLISDSMRISIDIGTVAPPKVSHSPRLHNVQLL